VALHGQKVEGEEVGEEGGGDAGDVLECFVGSYASDDGWGGADDSLLRLVAGRSLFRIYVAIGGGIGMVTEESHLSRETADSGIDVWFAEAVTYVADEVACGMIVTSIDNEVVAADDSGSIISCEAKGICIDTEGTVELAEPSGGAVYLTLSHFVFGIEYLTVQIAGTDNIVVDDSQPADASSCQIEGDGASEAASAYNECAGV